MNLKAYAIAAVMIACSFGSNAKMLDDKVLPKDWNQLKNADSFSVECRNPQTGVIDRESVDVDARTVTIETPGKEPVIRPILQFSLGGEPVQDKFGLPSGWDMHLAFASWAHRGYESFGLILSEGRWYSRHEDDTTWNCAN
jgi:hypothetical protein